VQVSHESIGNSGDYSSAQAAVLRSGGQKQRSTGEAFHLPSPLSPAMLNTHKLHSRSQGQQLKPLANISAGKRIVLGMSKRHGLAKFHHFTWFLFATVCVCL